MITLITGASKGIGHALAFEFAKHGHDLLISARNQTLLQDLATSVKQQYAVNVNCIGMDLGLSNSASQLIERIETEGYEIDCLVNNAGVGYLGDFVDMDPHYLNQMLQLNMVTVSELTRYFAKKFIEAGRGKILQVSSTAAFQPGPFMAAYYASKAYVASLSEGLAYELKDTGVNISILCPGPTQTEFFHAASMDESFLARGVLGVMSAEKVAKLAYRGLQKNKLFIIPGFINKTLAYSAAISPFRISRRITAFLHGGRKKSE
ncbi:short chain dehydrogenase [Legionella lansingensis]|uniref:Short chain dehydrogenase n=1 Tax=Legionella lansingensis TaxID=45067 RepID=A0A0W0VRL3_9GAMM|nr:SDR family oxidoreductase [Legionella lansingensis]KTD22796.1 short chain dehydrogenase [Legionella lansingensis]SNV49789.1 short chain dehydrogenase [Legionella lansingensis]